VQIIATSSARGDPVTLLYYDPIFLEHDTGRHPEHAGRLRAIVERLTTARLLEQCQRPPWQPVSLERLTRVHDQPYVAAIEKYAARGGGQIEVDTVVSPQSYNAALMAAGAVCDAVVRVAGGEAANALCLVRPPGHHALQNAPMGFCLLNSVAIAARVATRELGLDRVLIVDWDVHHGNGTQDTFWTDEQAGFLSIHRYPFYPGTGAADETGSGAGLGSTLNLPIAFGTRPRDYLARLQTELEQFANRTGPQLVLISAGFDAHRADPVGSLGLENEHFAELTRMLRQVANQHCEGRLVSALEGGYNPPVLAESVELHLRELL
jgi:acetoin utilization deacetylase AcuC-like enzyme